MADWQRTPKPEVMDVTTADLDWWLEIAQRLDWTWASTYADTSPHWYVPRERTKMLTLDEYHRALSVIWTFGHPEQFHGNVRLYLHGCDGTKYFATGDNLVNRYEVALINRAPIKDVYGEQEFSGFALDKPASPSPRDIGAIREGITPSAGDRKITAWRLVQEPGYVKSLLDVYAGVGGLVENKCVSPGTKYVAVDPSQARLNQLALRHRWVRDIRPQSPSELLAGDRERFDVVCCMNGEAGNLTAEELVGLWGKASKRMVLSYRGVIPKDHRAALSTLTRSTIHTQREGSMAYVSITRKA